MSQDGGDNHFLSAKERDLRPLLAEGIEALELDEKRAWQMEAFFEGAWFSGVRNGHAKLLDQVSRYRQDSDCSDPRQLPINPDHLERIEEEFREMMEASAEVLNLSEGRTLALWEYLSQAWEAGTRAYEDEVTATLIERVSDVGAEALRWLDGDDEAGR